MFSGSYKLRMCTCTEKCICKCIPGAWGISFQVTCISAWWVINFTTWEVNSIPKGVRILRIWIWRWGTSWKQCTILSDKISPVCDLTVGKSNFLGCHIGYVLTREHWDLIHMCMCGGMCVPCTCQLVKGALLWLFHNCKEGSSILVYTNILHHTHSKLSGYPSREAV